MEYTTNTTLISGLCRTRDHLNARLKFWNIFFLMQINIVSLFFLLQFYVMLAECYTETKIFDYNGRLNTRVQTIYKSVTVISKIDCCRACNLDDLCASVNYKYVPLFLTLQSIKWVKSWKLFNTVVDSCTTFLRRHFKTWVIVGSLY